MEVATWCLWKNESKRTREHERKFSARAVLQALEVGRLLQVVVVVMAGAFKVLRNLR
jgi:hypothetical protein